MALILTAILSLSFGGFFGFVLSALMISSSKQDHADPETDFKYQSEQEKRG